MSAGRQGFFDSMAPGARAAFFGLALAAVCFLFAFPVLWLLLTSLRPQSGVYYVYRGPDFTLGSYLELLHTPRLVRAFVTCGCITTLPTVLSLL